MVLRAFILMHLLLLLSLLLLSFLIVRCHRQLIDGVHRPALQTHCPRQHITIPCYLPAVLIERGPKAKECLAMWLVPSPRPFLLRRRTFGCFGV